MSMMSIVECAQAVGMIRAGTRQVALLFTVLRTVVDVTVKRS